MAAPRLMATAVLNPDSAMAKPPFNPKAIKR